MYGQCHMLLLKYLALEGSFNSVKNVRVLAPRHLIY